MHINAKGWSSPSEDVYLANSSILTDKLAPGLYQPSYENHLGYFLKKLPISTHKIIALPSSLSTQVVEDIKKFWAKQSEFLEYDLPYKRGILMQGKPGNGKSSTIAMICKQVMELGGYCLTFNDAENFEENLKQLKKVQPEARVVALMEELDQIMRRNSVSEILNMLDGVEKSVDNVVWLATTNHPELLDKNIKNRPSRFDRKFDFGDPTLETRLTYLSSLFKERDRIRFDLNKWGEDTEGFSLAHLKELFISVGIFDNNYKQVIAELKAMSENSVEDQE